MLQINSYQESVFDQSTLADYIQRMLIHVEQFFPEEYAELGEENTRLLITKCIEQAKAYELVSERDVCLFIDLWVVFGEYFETTTEYHWASEMLSDEDTPDPSMRIDSVHDASMQLLPE